MHKLVALALIALISLPCIAASSHRTPGLWQVTSSMTFVQGGIQIPPEVRQKMAASGIQLPDFSKPTTFKYCLTPEAALRDEQPQFTNDNSCTASKPSWSGSKFHSEFSCNQKGSPMHGKVEGTMSGDGKTYSGSVHIEGENPAMGGHYVMEGHASGKWLGPACGKDAG